MDEELELTTAEDIQNLIYTVRGKKVKLDSDVANLYHYETKKLNQAVKRNIERFPKDFCFQLTESELENLRSQFTTSSLEKIIMVEGNTCHMYLQNKELQCLLLY